MRLLEIYLEVAAILVEVTSWEPLTIDLIEKVSAKIQATSHLVLSGEGARFACLLLASSLRKKRWLCGSGSLAVCLD